MNTVAREAGFFNKYIPIFSPLFLIEKEGKQDTKDYQRPIHKWVSSDYNNLKAKYKLGQLWQNQKI